MIEALVRRLQSLLPGATLPLESGLPCSARLPDGGMLALRYVHEVPALCLAVPLGRLPAMRREEALVTLMRNNLYFADAGAPHLALAPNDEQVVLCRTVPLAGEGVERAGREVQRLIDGAPQARQGLLAQQVLGD